MAKNQREIQLKNEINDVREKRDTCYPYIGQSNVAKAAFLEHHERLEQLLRELSDLIGFQEASDWYDRQ